MLKGLSTTQQGALYIISLPVFAIGLVIAAPGVTAAQAGTTEGPSLGLVQASVSVDCNSSQRHHVTAVYEFRSEGRERADISVIEGVIWRFDRHRISNMSVRVNGQPVTVDRNRTGRVERVAVPVPDGEGVSQVQVTVSFDVRGPAGELRTPLWVPEFTPPSPDRAVRIEVGLPADGPVAGEIFPQPSRVSQQGRTVKFELAHVPGFVFITLTARGEGKPVTVTRAAAVAGAVLTGGMLLAWVLYRRRTRSKEGGER